jgi:hypothetical protein
VARDTHGIPVPAKAGLLTYGSSLTAAFPVSQWLFWPPLPAYSDEFVQVFHLFPFYPPQLKQLDQLSPETP